MEEVLRASVIEPVGGHGGMDYYDFGLCGGLAAAGVDVVLDTCDETVKQAEAPFVVRHSYRGIYGSAPAWLRGLRHLAGTLLALAGALHDRRRICHFHFFHVGLLHFASVLLARLLRRRVVITAHDVESFVQSLEVPVLSRWAYAMAHRIIAHNHVSRTELVSRLGVDEARIRVVPHGNYVQVMAPLPSQADARQTLGLAPEAQVVLFFGQIKDVKGLDVLIRAVARLAPDYPHLRLLIAGRPWKTGFSSCEQLIRELGIESRCHMHIRFIQDEEVPTYYAAADIVALPYRRIYQSGVLLLAMSYAKPVIVSDLAGMTEVVDAGVNGLVFEVDDDASLAACIRQGFDHPVELVTMADAGHVHVCKYHDWGLIGLAVRDVYREASC